MRLAPLRTRGWPARDRQRPRWMLPSESYAIESSSKCEGLAAPTLAHRSTGPLEGHSRGKPSQSRLGMRWLQIERGLSLLGLAAGPPRASAAESAHELVELGLRTLL